MAAMNKGKGFLILKLLIDYFVRPLRWDRLLHLRDRLRQYNTINHHLFKLCLREPNASETRAIPMNLKDVGMLAVLRDVSEDRPGLTYLGFVLFFSCLFVCFVWFGFKN